VVEEGGAAYSNYSKKASPSVLILFTDGSLYSQKIIVDPETNYQIKIVFTSIAILYV
jgi:hypothetical protein